MTRKTRTGTLYKRGQNWWLSYMICGKRVQQSLHVTTREEADKERKRIMRPFQAAEKADALAVIAQRLNVAQLERDRLEDEAIPALLIADAWDSFDRAGNRGTISKSTLKMYCYYWQAFTRWLSKHAPDAVELRQVGFSVAEAYKDYMLRDRGVT